jgi:hypothetical protein
MSKFYLIQIQRVSLKSGSWGQQDGVVLHDVLEKKGLAMNGENLKEIYLIQTKIVTEFSVAGVMGKKGG